MAVKSKKFRLKTTSHSQMIDITGDIEDLLWHMNITRGFVNIYIPHTTAGVTINENADPDVQRDMLTELDKIVPWDDGYKHAEGNSAAHIKASMMGFSLRIPVEHGKMILGTWQGIYFMEFDGPRTRNYNVTVEYEDD